jgi:hypothetical protein
MPTLQASDVTTFSEMLLLLSLTSQQQRPNLLIACADTALKASPTEAEEAGAAVVASSGQQRLHLLPEPRI